MIEKYRLRDGRPAVIHSAKGRLTVDVRESENIQDDMVMIYQGWWHQNGSVNVLTEDILSDIGNQAAYYDCFCRIERANG
jgi:anaerobic selenocysteine-containing dehydrogenase